MAPRALGWEGQGGDQRWTLVQKRAGELTERLGKECKGPGAGQGPGLGENGPNPVSKSDRVEEAPPPSGWPSRQARATGAVLCGRAHWLVSA